MNFFKFIYYSTLINILDVGGYRERVIPGSISNPEVKPLIADNTAGSPSGNVGRRQLLGCFFML